MQLVETMGLCSDPASHPAFDRLLRILSEGPEFLDTNSSVTWEKSVSTRKVQRQRRLTTEEVEELLYAYKAGELIYDLAERFSIHRSTVIEHVRRSGMKFRSKARRF